MASRKGFTYQHHAHTKKHNPKVSEREKNPFIKAVEDVCVCVCILKLTIFVVKVANKPTAKKKTKIIISTKKRKLKPKKDIIFINVKKKKSPGQTLTTHSTATVKVLKHGQHLPQA